jgi:5-methylcytosine-specific restriction endonuclease McrA
MSSADQLDFYFGGSGPDKAGAVLVGRRCAHCRQSVQVPDWYAEAVELHYCGDVCRQAWIAEQPDLQPKVGTPSHRRGANWAEQSNRARERDGFACRVCGQNEEEIGRQLDVHHKIPYRNFKSNVEANRLENLIALCPSCHAKKEAELRRELPLFGSASTGDK